MPKLTDEQRALLCRMKTSIEAADVVDAALARIDEVERMAQDMVFNCPSCGRHDFGFFAPMIAKACGPCLTRATAAEADNAKLRADVEALRAMLGLMLEHVPLGMRDDAFVSEAMALRAKTAVKS